MITEKEAKLLNTLINELSTIKIRATPETPTDPMVWSQPPVERTTPARVARQQPPSQRATRTTTTTTRIKQQLNATTRRSGAAANAASTLSNGKITSSTSTSMRRTSSQPRLDDAATTAVGADGASAPSEERSFDTTGYERELVDAIERTVIQRDLCVYWQDVAGHDGTKKTLSEAALLPMLFPDYFKARGCVFFMNRLYAVFCRV